MNVATGPKGPVTSSEESDEDKLMADQSKGGMFTNVDPSVRRIVPDAKGRTSRRSTDHHEPPRDRDGQPQRPPASHNCSASVRAALSRADGRPKQDPLATTGP